MDRQFMTYVPLPWVDHDGGMNLSGMTLVSPDKAICARKGRRIVRLWYKDQIGKVLPKNIVHMIWQDRSDTRSLTEDATRKQFNTFVEGMIHEEIEDNANSSGEDSDT